MNNEQQTQADDPSGPGWRWVEASELLRKGDMFRDTDRAWTATTNAGQPAIDEHTYRRRIEPPQQTSDSEQRSESTLWGKLHAAMKQDPEFAWTVHCNYAMQIMDEDVAHGTANRAAARIMLYFHHIDITQNHHWATMFEGATPPHPSDSEPETMEQLRQRLDAAVRQNVELADSLANEQNKKGAYERIAKASVERAREAERSGQQVNAELQQLRKQLMTSQYLAEMSRRQVADEASKVERLKDQVRDLTQELKDKSDSYQMCLQSHYKAGQQSTIDRLQSWLRPVLELVAEHPDDCGPLAVAVLGFLPGIASRLIEES